MLLTADLMLNISLMMKYSFSHNCLAKAIDELCISAATISFLAKGKTSFKTIQLKSFVERFSARKEEANFP